MVKVNLTERQAQILSLYNEGKTQTEIAKELNIVQSAVSSCLRRIAKKIGVKDMLVLSNRRGRVNVNIEI